MPSVIYKTNDIIIGTKNTIYSFYIVIIKTIHIADNFILNSTDLVKVFEMQNSRKGSFSCLSFWSMV